MGRLHKKKIAEYKAAENEKTENNSDVEKEKRSDSVDARGSDVNNDLEDSKNNVENGGGSKNSKKRKSTSGSKKEVAKKKSKTKESNEEKDDGEEINNEGEEYEVKEIVDHKIENGVSYFLVRWKGYTKDDDTWEPEDTLSCDALIAKYRKKNNQNIDKTRKVNSAKKKQKDKGDGDSGPEEYEVEKIINYAEEKTGRVFLIRWKGYRAKHDTWEPEAHLNCKEMIEKFMERMKNLSNANFKELRREPKKTKRLVNEIRSPYTNPTGRTSKRAVKKRIYYGDSDN